MAGTNPHGPDFPEDGSNQTVPNERLWAEHDAEQQETNTVGAATALAALRSVTIEAPEPESGVKPAEGSVIIEEPELFPNETPVVEAQEKPERPKKVAFGGFTKLPQYDIFGDYDLSDLTDQEKAWITPDKIGSMLFGAADEGDLAVDGIALNSYEFGFILRARDPKHLGAVAKTRALGTHDLNEEVIGKSNRAPIHALESKQVAMQEHLGLLKERREAIKILQKEAHSPGYAHITAEEMKDHINNAWQEFTTMLDVVHVQRDWTNEQRERANAAMINYLTQGSSRERVGHWQGMLQLANRYVGARISLFGNRINRTTKFLETKTKAS